MMTAQHEVSRRLRDARERRGLTLKAIADSTKIPIGLLAGLERGDCEHWPSGLFGRAHLRAYAATVGLSSEPWLVEFLGSLGHATAPTQAVCTLTPEGGPRLTLAEDRRWALTSTSRRVLASAVDVCGIFAVAMVLAWNLEVDLALACAVVGLSYYALATLVLGQSVTLWWVSGHVLHGSGNRTRHRRPLMWLVPRRGLRNAHPQHVPVEFLGDRSTSVRQAASR